jgi:two-component system LytT family response regulator
VTVETRIIAALIVEDEPLARTRLRRLLETHPDVHVVGEASSVHEALALIAAHDPDLLFLDIHMPEETGLDLLRNFPAAKQPVVVFTTSHAEYALSAFNFNAADYLLKPFDADRLARAVERARRLLAGELSAVPARRGSAHRERFAVRARNETVFIKSAQIDWISAEGNYSRLHCGRESYLIRETLQSLEDALDVSAFLRIHRSSIVNIDKIRKLVTTADGALALVLTTGDAIPLGPSYRARLDTILGTTPR